MVNVQTVKLNYQEAGQKMNYSKIGSAPSFHGAPLALEALDVKDRAKILSGVEAIIDKKTGIIGYFSQILANNKGEFQSQLINGFFTTTLCPLFIAFNPISHQDKKTKEYTALRQPISAALALTGGLSMTKLINNYTDKIFNDGNVSNIDTRVKPTDTYLKRMFNKEMRKAKSDGKFNEFLKTYEPDDFNYRVKNTKFKSNGKPTSDYLVACRKGYIKNVQDARTEIFSKLVGEDPNIISIKDGIISVGSEPINTAKIPNLNSSEDLKPYLDANNLHSRKVRDLLKDKFKFEFYGSDEGVLANKFKPKMIEQNLSSVNAIDFLREMGLIDDKVTENDLLDVIKANRQSKHTKEYANLHHISETEAGFAQTLQGQDTTRSIQMSVGEAQGKAEKLSLGQFLHQIGYKTKDGTLQGLMDLNMKDALGRFHDIFKGKLKGYNSEATLKLFAKNIVKNMGKISGDHAAQYAEIAGIFFNLGTTAITCTALNWVYPRLMEKFFPSLCESSDAKKGGNK